MKTKRKRITSKGIMAAWSNGSVAHIIPMYAKEVGGLYGERMAEYHHRVAEGYEWEVDERAVMRGESRLIEEESDRLWAMGRHVEALNCLMDAAMRLVDWDLVTIGPDTNHNHRNLVLFRYMVRRCWERVAENPSLEPLAVEKLTKLKGKN